MKADQKELSQRILIIDDNPAIHDDFKKILCDHGGADSELNELSASLFGETKVVTAKRPRLELGLALQGQEGLTLLQAALESGRPFLMAFVDVRMPPGWDGIETTARLWEVDPNLQVVICTAYSDYSWDEMLAKLGNSDRLVILKKPFDAVEVLQLASALSEKYRLLQQVRGHLAQLEETVQSRTKELRKSEEHFRLITENAGELIGIIDTQDNWVYYSLSYERVLGYPLAELATMTPSQLVHPADLESFRASIWNVLMKGLRQVIEYRVRHQNGSWLNLEANAALFRNSGSVMESVLLVARDVTERHQMEIQLRQSQKLESVGQLAAGIAHEINTPAQYVGDNTRFLQDAFGSLVAMLHDYGELLAAAKAGRVSPELVAQVETTFASRDIEYLCAQIPTAILETLEGVDRVSKIVRAMKEFSHPGGKEKALSDLNKAIESTTTVARNEWKYVADLDLALAADLPLVPCFLGEFNQAMLNLIVNAAHAIGDVVKATPGRKGKISIRTVRVGEEVEVRVTDTGTGIAEKHRAKIFEPFFTTKDVGKGTGQGLSVVYSNIVKKHGGTVTFETEVGRGTTFIIRLPIKPTIGSLAHSEMAAAVQENGGNLSLV